MSYRMTNQDIMHAHNKYGSSDGATAEAIQRVLYKHLPPGVIRRETASNIYILCPLHQEKTASVSIAKKKGGFVKCFGCGRGMLLSTFLSQTLGNTRKYRHDKLT